MLVGMAVSVAVTAVLMVVRLVPAGVTRGAGADRQQVVPRVDPGVVVVAPLKLDGIVAHGPHGPDVDVLRDRADVERADAGALIDTAGTPAGRADPFGRVTPDVAGAPGDFEDAVFRVVVDRRG